MDKLTKEILELLKGAFEASVGTFEYRNGSEMQAYWLENYENNIIRPMSKVVRQAYDEGAGKEISSGKMGALKSSSALTYNLFWKQEAEISKPQFNIGRGLYSVEFEKKLDTIKLSSAPATIDAFLHCKDSGEALACEMKMTEWLGNPDKLSEAYLIPERYIDSQEVFTDVVRALVQESDLTGARKYSSIFSSYDAFQMLKHTISLYRACFEGVLNVKKLTLLNCVWALSSPKVLQSEASRRRYIQKWNEEKREFEEFKAIMQPIIELFGARLGVEFDIQFCTFSELLSMLKKSPEELKYLERYLI